MECLEHLIILYPVAKLRFIYNDNGNNIIDFKRSQYPWLIAVLSVCVYLNLTSLTVGLLIFAELSGDHGRDSFKHSVGMIFLL